MYPEQLFQPQAPCGQSLHLHPGPTPKQPQHPLPLAQPPPHPMFPSLLLAQLQQQPMFPAQLQWQPLLATSIPATSIPAASIPATSIPATSIPAAFIPATSIPATSIPDASIPATSTKITSRVTLDEAQSSHLPLPPVGLSATSHSLAPGNANWAATVCHYFNAPNASFPDFRLKLAQTCLEYKNDNLQMLQEMGHTADEELRGILNQFHSLYEHFVGPQLMDSTTDTESAERKLQAALLFPLHTVCRISAYFRENAKFSYEMEPVVSCEINHKPPKHFSDLSVLSLSRTSEQENKRMLVLIELKHNQYEVYNKE